MQETNLPEWDKDLPERVAAFNTAIQPLLGKYELALSAQVGVTPDGRLEGRPVVLSVRKDPATGVNEEVKEVAEPVSDKPEEEELK